jgi:hypothetical protein
MAFEKGLEAARTEEEIKRRMRRKRSMVDMEGVCQSFVLVFLVSFVCKVNRVKKREREMVSGGSRGEDLKTIWAAKALGS